MAAKRKSLAEELLELVDPAPRSFDPERTDLDESTIARLAASYKEEDEGEGCGEETAAPLRLRAGTALLELSEDPRYSGRAVLRRSLEEEKEECEVEGVVEPFGTLLGEERSGGEGSEGEEEEGWSQAVDEENPEDMGVSQYSVEEGKPLVFSSQQDDTARGQAVAQQISLWESLLEGRIRLQKLLPLCNRLPQGDKMAAFLEASNPPLAQNQQMCCLALQGVLDQLLEVQQTLLLGHKDTRDVVLGRGRDQGEGAATTGSSPRRYDSDEEIESDTADEEADPVNQKEAIPDNNSLRRSSRKRPPKPWCLHGGKREYEGYVTDLQEQFKGYRDDTISKWGSKAHLSSGKVSSKTFLNVDQSILGQVAQVLQDKDRLVRRTQLKRSSFKVLGKPSNAPEGVTSGNEDSVLPHPEPNAHLKDYDEEIFDDSDFYHQLLHNLIEHKMDGTTLSDSAAMGRQWLELHKLRGKVKRKVDTKASKGRKLRYQVHQKLVGFMAPLEREGPTDTAKDDLFSSLFGQRQLH